MRLNQKPESPLLILGMHRSGTSLLASILQAHGIAIGNELVGASEGNPHGHFEDASIVAFHERVLTRLCPREGRVFDNGTMVVEPTTMEFLPEEIAEARDLAERCHQPQLWGWKDPRTCLFIKLWREVLGSFRSVIIFRHPIEVYYSFLRRGNNFDQLLYPEAMIRAYGRYNQELLRLHDAEPGQHLILHANAAFRDHSRLALELQQFTGLPFDPERIAARFQRDDFNSLGISDTMHAIFAAVFPAEASVFDELSQRAAWTESVKPQVSESPELSDLVTGIQAIARVLPDSARPQLFGILECACSQVVGESIRKMRERIADKMRQMLELHERERCDHKRMVAGFMEQSIVIEKLAADNEKLAADNKAVAEGWHSQKQIIEEQAAKLDKIWNELETVGKSWERQHALLQEWDRAIKNLHSEVKNRDDIIARLENELTRLSASP